MKKKPKKSSNKKPVRPSDPFLSPDEKTDDDLALSEDENEEVSLNALEPDEDDDEN